MEQRMDSVLLLLPVSASQLDSRVKASAHLMPASVAGTIQGQLPSHLQVGIPESASFEDSIDGMGIVFTEETECGYFGTGFLALA